MPETKNPLRALGKSIEHAAETVEDRIEDAVAGSREIEPLIAVAEQVPWWGHVRRFWPALIVLTALAAFFFSGAWREINVDGLNRHYAQLSAWSLEHPITFRFGMIALIAGMTSFGLPGTGLIIVAGGIFLGIVEASIYAVLADGLGANFLFFAARRAIYQGDTPASIGMVDGLREGFAKHPMSYALFLRVVPVFPYGPVSVALTWLGCNYRMFLFTSMAGVLPSVIVYSAIGASIAPTLAAGQAISAEVLTQPHFYIPLLGLALLSLIPVFMGLKKAPRLPR